MIRRHVLFVCASQGSNCCPQHLALETDRGSLGPYRTLTRVICRRSTVHCSGFLGQPDAQPAS